MGTTEVDYRAINRSGSGSPPAVTVRQVWTASGMLWPAANLVAVAIGLFPQWVSPGSDGVAALPALQALTTGQVGFALVIYPLLLLRRGSRSAWLDLGELALWAGIAAPFIVVVAHMSDAGVADVVRAALMTGTAFVTGWCLGCVGLIVGRGGAIVVLTGLVAAVAGPLFVYVTREFAGPACGSWLARLCPTALAWSIAGSRQGGWLPSPAWAWLVWPVAAAAIAWGVTLRHGSRKETL